MNIFQFCLTCSISGFPSQFLNPSSKSTSTALAGKAANIRFLVQIQGKILQQYTGMDGFTVFGGKMIVTYSE